MKELEKVRDKYLAKANKLYTLAHGDKKQGMLETSTFYDQCAIMVEALIAQ